MIYLDHNATTRLRPEALEAMANARLVGRNPMSLHRPGRRARVGLDAARESIRQLCGAPKADVIFTSGGTEADHLAVKGLARAQRRLRGADTVLMAEIEHPAVTEAADSLRHEGFKIVEIPADRGYVQPSAVEELLKMHCVAVVVVMVAHNTTGIVQPLSDITKLATSAGVPVHADAVQAAGKIPLKFYDLGCTTMALSAHKFGGPRGVGALVMQKCTELDALWTGGGQEEGKRSGSHANILITGMAAAADSIQIQVDEMAKKRNWLQEQLVQVAGVEVVGMDWPRLPNTLALTIQGTTGRSFVALMDEKGVAVSAGAACHSGTGGGEPASRVRFSLSKETSMEEIKTASSIAIAVIEALREEA